MKIYFVKIFSIIVFLLFIPISVFGQFSDYKSPAYNWFDTLIGKANTDIFNGLEYVEKHRMLNEKHKFFINPNFSNGAVIFNNQPYFNLNLKYDLFEGQLLLRYSDEPNIPTILLDKSKITEFSINNHQFKRLSFKTKKGEEFVDFYEVLLNSDSLKLYKRNYRRIRTKTNDRIRYYEFKEQNSYLVFFKGTYQQINKLNNLLSLFPQFKNQLKQKEKEYKYLIRKDTDSYLKLVFEDLIKLSSR